MHYRFFFLFFIINNNNIHITFTIRTNNTYNTLETTKERKKEYSYIYIYILYPAKYKEKQYTVLSNKLFVN